MTEQSNIEVIKSEIMKLEKKSCGVIKVPDTALNPDEVREFRAWLKENKIGLAVVFTPGIDRLEVCQ